MRYQPKFIRFSIHSGSQQQIYILLIHFHYTVKKKKKINSYSPFKFVGSFVSNHFCYTKTGLPKTGDNRAFSPRCRQKIQNPYICLLPEPGI